MLSYGSGQQRSPFGNGWSCLAGSVQIVPGAVVASGLGTASKAIDLSLPSFISGPNAIHPGSTWNFQLAYRDPAGSPSALNFTDALHLVFAPRPGGL